MIDLFIYLCMNIVLPLSEASQNIAPATSLNDFGADTLLEDVPKVAARMPNPNPARLNPSWVRSVNNYTLMLLPATWVEARKLCETNGLNFAAIESREQLYEVMMVYRLSELAQQGEMVNVWLGGSNLDGKKEFMWETNPKRHLSYTNWMEGEPNNYDGNEHCVEMQTENDYQWNDAPCQESQYFLCQKVVLF